MALESQDLSCFCVLTGTKHAFMILVCHSRRKSAANSKIS